MKANQGIDSKDVSELLARMLTSHAYRERLAAARFEDALALAPDTRAHAYVAGVVAEEIEHYQACLAAGRRLELDVERRVEERLSREPQGIPPFHTWLDVLLAHALNDEAGLFVLRGLIGSSVPEYAALARHIVDDEVLHGSRGRGMLIAYWPNAPLSNVEKAAKFTEHVDAGFRCLGRPDTRGDALAVRAGLKTIPASELIRSYRAYVKAVEDQLGIVNVLLHRREDMLTATAGDEGDT